MSSKNSKEVVVRFPPSPTGRFHIGSARTALFNYLFAKHCGGKLLLRIEDTDLGRSEKKHESDILEGLDALGIRWEGEMWRQSERTDVYKKYLEQMIDAGTAYEGEENKDGTGKVIRFKNPNKEVAFNDLIRGEIKFDTTDLGDFVIARDIETPLYHLTVVVDDYESGVTHVIRGEDGISNTPRQILLQEAIGANTLHYAHIPLILAPDKSKMSKRHGATAIGEYLDKGYLPEAMVNFLALLGWSAGDDRELYTMNELAEAFDLPQVHKGGAIFNEEKLRWFNREYLQNVSNEDFMAGVQRFLPTGVDSSKFLPLLADLRERVHVYSDIATMLDAGEYAWLDGAGKYEAEHLVWKKGTKENTLKHLKIILDILEDVSGANFTNVSIKEALWELAEREGKGDVLWPLRFALTGMDRSPDPFTVAGALGKDETLTRVQNALRALE